MIVTRKAIPRRAMLRGLGATVALPFLDAMVPAFGRLAAAAPNIVAAEHHLHRQRRQHEDLDASRRGRAPTR